MPKIIHSRLCRYLHVEKAEHWWLRAPSLLPTLQLYISNSSAMIDSLLKFKESVCKATMSCDIYVHADEQDNFVCS